MSKRLDFTSFESPGSSKQVNTTTNYQSENKSKSNISKRHYSKINDDDAMEKGNVKQIDKREGKVL